MRVEGSGWNFEEVGYEGGLRAIEERRFDTSSILCSNDRLAIGLLAAAYEKGLRVGRGAGSALRIAGHDNHPFSRFTCPSLTTVAQDYDSISRRSVETLVELVKGDGRTEVRTEMLFSGTLVMRESA